MKNLFIGIGCGLLIGAGAFLGISQIPSVNKALISSNSNSSKDYADVETDKTIADLKLLNEKLKHDYENLSNEFENVNNQLITINTSLEEKTALVNTLTEEKNNLENLLEKLQNVDLKELEDENVVLSQENLELKNQLEAYEDLLGTDVSYAELVANLNEQLSEKTIALESVTEELEQLRLDKETLTTQVFDMSIRLQELEEKLSNYENIDNIDKLNVSNFNGVWYKNGTFEDYYTIENGVVTHNSNEDKGLLNNIYNQMYLMMNTSGGQAVELSDDGTYFVTEDNSIYSKFYINTVKEIVSDFSFVGEYSFGSEKININSDKTITYTTAENVYIGTYTVKMEEKNIGGNITKISYLTANYHTETENIVNNYEIYSQGYLINKENNNYYNIVNAEPILFCSSNFEVPTTNYLKVTIKTSNLVTILPDETALLTFDTVLGNKYFNVNGYYLNINSANLTNKSGNVLSGYYFDLYFTSINNVTIYNILTFGGEEVEIVDIQDNGNFISFIPERSYLRYFYDNKTKQFNTIDCQVFDEFVNGSYVSESFSIIITDDSVLINDVEAISIDKKAETDGYDIYTTLTIEYVDTEEISHTLVIKLKNNNIVSSTLDSENLILTKD